MELAIVVCIIGVLAMMANEGMHRFLSATKEAEARNALGQISKDAATKFEKDSVSAALMTQGASTLVSNLLCASAPATVPAGGVPPSGRKYQSSKADWDGAMDPAVGWYCLHFEIDAPQYYLYSYSASGTMGLPGDTFTAAANGDLNGDGVMSTIAIIGGINSASLLEIAPNFAETNPDD